MKAALAVVAIEPVTVEASGELAVLPLISRSRPIPMVTMSSWGDGDVEAISGGTRLRLHGRVDDPAATLTGGKAIPPSLDVWMGDEVLATLPLVWQSEAGSLDKPHAGYFTFSGDVTVPRDSSESTITLKTGMNGFGIAGQRRLPFTSSFQIPAGSVLAHSATVADMMLLRSDQGSLSASSSDSLVLELPPGRIGAPRTSVTCMETGLNTNVFTGMQAGITYSVTLDHMLTFSAASWDSVTATVQGNDAILAEGVFSEIESIDQDHTVGQRISRLLLEPGTVVQTTMTVPDGLRPTDVDHLVVTLPPEIADPAVGAVTLVETLPDSRVFNGTVDGHTLTGTVAVEANLTSGSFACALSIDGRKAIPGPFAGLSGQPLITETRALARSEAPREIVTSAASAESVTDWHPYLVRVRGPAQIIAATTWYQGAGTATLIPHGEDWLLAASDGSPAVLAQLEDEAVDGEAPPVLPKANGRPYVYQATPNQAGITSLVYRASQATQPSARGATVPISVQVELKPSGKAWKFTVTVAGVKLPIVERSVSDFGKGVVVVEIPRTAEAKDAQVVALSIAAAGPVAGQWHDDHVPLSVPLIDILRGQPAGQATEITQRLAPVVSISPRASIAGRQHVPVTIVVEFPAQRTAAAGKPPISEADARALVADTQLAIAGHGISAATVVDVRTERVVDNEDGSVNLVRSLVRLRAIIDQVQRDGTYDISYLIPKLASGPITIRDGFLVAKPIQVALVMCYGNTETYLNGAALGVAPGTLSTDVSFQETIEALRVYWKNKGRQFIVVAMAPPMLRSAIMASGEEKKDVLNATSSSVWYRADYILDPLLPSSRTPILGESQIFAAPVRETLARDYRISGQPAPFVIVGVDVLGHGSIDGSGIVPPSVPTETDRAWGQPLSIIGLIDDLEPVLASANAGLPGDQSTNMPSIALLGCFTAKTLDSTQIPYGATMPEQILRRTVLPIMFLGCDTELRWEVGEKDIDKRMSPMPPGGLLRYRRAEPGGSVVKDEVSIYSEFYTKP